MIGMSQSEGPLYMWLVYVMSQSEGPLYMWLVYVMSESECPLYMWLVYVCILLLFLDVWYLSSPPLWAECKGV